MSVELDPTAAEPFAEATGVTAPTDPEGRPGFLSDVIIELGYAEAEIVDEAVEQSRLVGKVAESILIENATITEEQLARAIAERNGLPYVDLSRFAVDAGAQELIGSNTASRYRAAPIAFDADGALIVALADPLDALAVSDIGVITKSEVRPAVATDSGIEALLATMSERPPTPVAASSEELADDGPDGAPDSSAWTLSRSISSLERPPAPAEPDPSAEAAATPPPSRPASDAGADPRSPQAIHDVALALEGRIAELVSTALDPAAEEIERLSARVEKLERKSRQFKSQRDQYKAELERGPVRDAD